MYACYCVYTTRKDFACLILTETNKVAQRLTEEVKKAFLPTITAPTIAYGQARLKIIESDETVAENETLPTQDIEKKTTISIIQPKSIAWQASEVTLSTTLPVVIMPVDSTKKEKKKRNSIPFSIKDYNYFSQVELKPNKVESVSRIFDKEKTYLVQFYHAKEKSRIYTPMEITVLQGDKNIEVSKTAEGYTFTPTQTRTHQIQFKNIPKDIRIITMIYEYDKKTAYPQISLQDETGKKIKYRTKTTLNQNFQLTFSAKANYTDLEIHEVLVTIRRKDKGIVSEKVFNTPNFNLGNLQVQKDDKVSIRVTEFSGKLNGVLVENPKTNRYFDMDIIFSIQPEIK